MQGRPRLRPPAINTDRCGGSSQRVCFCSDSEAFGHILERGGIPTDVSLEFSLLTDKIRSAVFGSLSSFHEQETQ